MDEWFGVARSRTKDRECEEDRSRKRTITIRGKSCTFYVLRASCNSEQRCWLDLHLVGWLLVVVTRETDCGGGSAAGGC